MNCLVSMTGGPFFSLGQTKSLCTTRHVHLVTVLCIHKATPHTSFGHHVPPHTVSFHHSHLSLIPPKHWAASAAALAALPQAKGTCLSSPQSNATPCSSPPAQCYPGYHPGPLPYHRSAWKHRRRCESRRLRTRRPIASPPLAHSCPRPAHLSHIMVQDKIYYTSWFKIRYIIYHGSR